MCEVEYGGKQVKKKKKKKKAEVMSAENQFRWYLDQCKKIRLNNGQK